MEFDRLVHTDAADLLHSTPSAVADLVVTDPPWGTSSLKMDAAGPGIPAAIWAECARVLRPAGWLMVFGPLPTQIPIATTPGLHQYLELIWSKPAIGCNRQKAARPTATHENIQLYHKGAPSGDRYYDAEAARTSGHPPYRRVIKAKYRSGTWQDEQGLANQDRVCASTDGTRGATTVLYYAHKPCMPRSERTRHPTQKPLALLRYLIRAWCPPGGLVVDPFAGSGTHLLAAKLLGRRYLGSEIDPAWYDLAARRLADDSLAAEAAPAAPPARPQE